MVILPQGMSRRDRSTKPAYPSAWTFWTCSVPARRIVVPSRNAGADTENHGRPEPRGFNRELAVKRERSLPVYIFFRPFRARIHLFAYPGRRSFHFACPGLFSFGLSALSVCSRLTSPALFALQNLKTP